MFCLRSCEKIKNAHPPYACGLRRRLLYIYTWDCRTPLASQPHPYPQNNPPLIFARPPFINKILPYVWITIAKTYNL